MTISADRTNGLSAYVLHSRPYRETSALVDMLTADYGRVRLLVKGVRRPKSRLKIATQPFMPISIGWTGRGDLKTLSDVESQGFLPPLQGRALCCGLYLNELTVRLLPAWDAAPRLFAYYRLALEGLQDAEMEEAVLRVFEHRLLDELGIAPALTHQASGQPVAEEEFYTWDTEQGFIPVADQNGYLGEHLQAIAEDDYQRPEVRRTAKKLMRQLLQQQLGERPLASRALFTNMPPTSTNMELSND